MSLAPLYRRALCVLGGALLAVSLSFIGANAADCRTLATVQHSAILTNNATDQGHVAGHVHGQPIPTTWTTFLNKTQFNSVADFNAAWSDFAAANLGAYPPDCPDDETTEGKNVSVTILPHLTTGTNYAGVRCTNATCTTTTPVQFTRVQFYFHKKTNGNWVLNTAYPTN